MALADDIAALPVSPTAGQAGHDANHGTVHQAAQAHQAAIAGLGTAATQAATTPADSLHVWGHSYASGVGVGVTAGVDDFVTILAESVGLPLRNEAIGGTTLTSYTGGGANWTNVLQKMTRPARFSSPHGCHLSMYGINDIAFLGNTPALLAPFIMAQRVVISRLRASRIFEDNDPTVVLAGAGAWSTNVNVVNSGTQSSYNATAGATITITTPAEFPGGTLALGFISWNDGGGATATVTVNGVTYSINTAATSRTDSRDCAVLRIPNVPAGSASYVVTTSAVTGVGCVFDYWQYEPTEAACPLVVLVKQPKPLDYTAYPTGAVTDAGVDAINTAFDGLAAEFGSRVVTVDTSSMDKSAAYFVAGNIHPNKSGHRVLAELVRTAIAGYITPVVAPQVKAARVEYGTSLPTGTATNWRVGDQVVNIAPTTGSPPGWICTVAGAPGTWAARATLDSRLTWGTAAPTTGTAARGDLVFNNNAAPGINAGWICTTAGTPGVWSQLPVVRVGSGQATLVGGTVTVNNASVTNGTTQIRVWTQSVLGTPGALYISAKNGGVSFTISSTSTTDNSVVDYEVLTY